MILIQPFWIGAFYAVSEILIASLLRSKEASDETDRGSLRLIWIVINICVVGAIIAAYQLSLSVFDDRATWYWVGLIVFVVSLVLRWYSIFYLGKFFTVNVAIAADHKVVDTGPYRYVRHPSYVGVLGGFLGLGLCLGNWISLLLLMLPITAVFVHRMNVEEAVLQTGIGESYRLYMAKTKRLIPFVY